MALQGPLGFYSFSAEVRPLCSPCLMVGPFPIKLVRAQLDVTQSCHGYLLLLAEFHGSTSLCVATPSP